jgi:putative ABC transport system substrate-binding protein
MITRSTLRSRLAALMAAFAAAIALPQAVSAEPLSARQPAPTYREWFQYSDEAKTVWEVVPDARSHLRIAVRMREAAKRAGSKRIFVLYPRASSAYDVAISKILEVFEDKDIAAEFTVVNFNNNDDAGQVALAEAKDGKYDLIFSMGSESTAWLYQHYKNGRMPVISVCSKDPVLLGQMRGYDGGSGNNFAFTSLNAPIEGQMAYLLELKPGLKNLAVLVDSKNVSAVQTQAEPMAAEARRRGIQFLMVAVQDPARAREELSTLVPAAVATMRKNDPTLTNSMFWITGSTSVFKEIATINAGADRVPVLSAVPEVVKAGNDSAVLSVGISFESNAHLAAVYAADVLSGRARVGDLKVGVVTPPDIAINFRKSREIGLQMPFRFFESATSIYDYEGRPARQNGKSMARRD